MVIRAIYDGDVNSVTEMYNYHISETTITFETEIVTAHNISERISKIKSDNLPWIVAQNGSENVIGCAYASK